MNPLENPRFQCVRLIGKGSFGEVYQVYDTWLKRVIAIKCIDQHGSDELAALRLLSGKRHEYLVEIYDVIVDEEKLYILMAYVPGRNLKDYCKEQGALNRREALCLLQEILEVLAWLHQMGIVYNDLKPENIIYLPNKHFCLIDFGACFLMMKAPLKRYGSPVFASPEYKKGEQIDGRSDLYSLGCTAKQVFNQQAQNYYSLFIDRCLKIDPSDRYASAIEALKKLNRYYVRRIIGKSLLCGSLIWFSLIPWMIPVFYCACLQIGWYEQAVYLLPEHLDAYEAMYYSEGSAIFYQLSQLPIEQLTTQHGKEFVLNYVSECLEYRLAIVNTLAIKCEKEAWSQIILTNDTNICQQAMTRLVEEYTLENWQKFIKTYLLQCTDLEKASWMMEYLQNQSTSLRQEIYQQLDCPEMLRLFFYIESVSELKSDIALRLFQTGAFQEGWLHRAIQLTSESEKKIKLEQMIIQWGSLS